MKLSANVGVSLVRWIALVVGVALLSAGCSGGDGKPNPQKITADNLCDEVAKAACYNMWHCCTGAQLEAVFGQTLTTDESKCRDDEKLICERLAAPLLQAVTDKKASLDEKLAAKCLDGMVLPDTKECFIQPTDDQFQQNLANNCDLAVTGLVAEGGDCLNSFECADNVKGAVCSTFYGSVGKCISPIAQGVGCSLLTGDCMDGLYCASTETATSGAACDSIDKTKCSCAAQKAASSKCCYNGECAKGLFCDIPNTATNCAVSTTGTAGSCTTTTAAGGSCYSATDASLTSSCATNYYCVVGVCSNDNTAPCYNNGTCGTGNTCNGRVCALISYTLNNYCIALNNLPF